MNKTNRKPELIVLVDTKGNSIGTAPKLQSHNAHTPLHLAFSVYVFNNRGEFLLTQRAKSKKAFPGIWTNTCCGHPAPDEKIEDAIKRRLGFELVLFPKKIEVAIPDFKYTAEMNGIVENEFCPVYLTKVSGEPTLNKEEVEDYRWVKWDEFLQEIETNPEGYSVWAVAQTKLLKDNPLINKFTISQL